MARFSVYKNPEGKGFLLDVQADLLDHLNTRVVVPLLPPSAAPAPAHRLNPVFQVGGQAVVMATQFMAAIPAPVLKVPVHSLADSRNEITAALDLLFQGF
jgi:toxin CcdB